MNEWMNEEWMEIGEPSQKCLGVRNLLTISNESGRGSDAQIRAQYADRWFL